MKTVWKYKIRIEDRTVADIPVGAIFRVLEQRSDSVYCTLWYEVPDTDAEMETHTFGIFGTGHPLPNEPMTYLGTTIDYRLSLAFHVYEMVR